jgi:hypothetical protein
MSKKKKIAEEGFVFPPAPTEAYIVESTTDSVSLNLLPVPIMEQPRSRWSPNYLETSATPEMLDALVLAIRHKRSEAEGSEVLSINEKGIFWKRFRGK